MNRRTFIAGLDDYADRAGIAAADANHSNRICEHRRSGYTIVESLARPGGNATGFSNWEPAMGGKPLALLKEVAPGVNRMLVMVNSGSDSNQHEVRANEAAAQSSTGQVLLPPPE